MGLIALAHFQLSGNWEGLGNFCGHGFENVLYIKRGFAFFAAFFSGGCLYIMANLSKTNQISIIGYISVLYEIACQYKFPRIQLN